MTKQSTRKQRYVSILGLALEDSGLRGVLLRRKNGHLLAQKTVLIPLEKDFLSANPDQLGRHIRDHLNKAGIKESRCVISLPLEWISTVETTIPDLPEADVASFIEIEAERGFLYTQDSLTIRSSRIRCPDGKRFATLIAIPNKHLQILDRILKAARLRPVSFTPGLTALQPPDSEPGIGLLSLVPSHQGIDLQITCGGGVAVLRSVDVLAQTDEVPGRVNISQLYREIRITLGQLPQELRLLIRKVKIFGQEDISRQLTLELPARMESLGLTCESIPTCAETFLDGVVTPNQGIDPALMVAAHELRNLRPAYEFLPPKTSPWKQISEKFHSKKLAWISTALAGAGLLLAGLFFYQHWKLSRLENQWEAMRPNVEELAYLQYQIKTFRPWFDPTFRSLRILKGLTQAFPDTGAVTAKTIEIRPPFAVTCSGEANDRQALLEVMDRLSAAPEVQQLKVDQIRGKTTMQFTFNFQWESGGASE